ncbi:hypothetical protein L596_026086 [Steinernema carpocapsae]|uniref:Transcription factor TFIIB cyclin-like domain-containing protein n=1 Tax=Steinernema carpocapsae TaxID=34508 RepID=A0A4U5M0A9_STECR|nr:hypothetical protein L596_026086 [Steinernema carpocapsae]
MSRFCGNLDLPHHIRRAATTIAKLAVDLDIVAGRSPVTVSAGAIYLACNAGLDIKKRKTAKEIGQICGAAEVTVKNTYKLLLPRAKELFPKDFQFAYSIS